MPNWQAALEIVVTSSILANPDNWSRLTKFNRRAEGALIDN
jgi:hypothetical protein